ncbi:DUF6415 family natural product biosynthesis protein [Streptomyces sp. enrichment culture]|uniref:DUF6415 family natural product biosynthesis protein n=1 Tax=Streptomyces sp. enrichment culture TaxID=1795815 RepID=UPI003F5643DB
MRLSLSPRRASCQRCGQDRQALGEPSVRRDQVVSAAETVTLVLGEDSPLPETAADVEDLALRLRGHINQLGALTSSQEPTLLRAQQLCSDGIPEGFLPSRVHLVNLAEATQELVVRVRHDDIRTTPPTRRWAWRKPQPNVLRGVVFALALACLMWAASVPQT